MEEQLTKPYVIGLDLGGTNSVFGIVDTRGEIKATTAIKTQGYTRVEDYVDASVEALQVIIDQVGGIDKIKAMGIGAPNANYYNGTIEKAPNLIWAKDTIVPLGDMFSEKLGIPVAITNDANAAAIGEMTYGVARGMKMPASWATSPCAAPTVARVAAVATAVLRLTALQPVLPAQPARCSRRATSLRCSAKWIPRRLLLSTCR